MRGLTDKVVIVAGGASGIGAATARRLAEEGAAVMVGDIDAAGAEKVAGSIRECGGRAVAQRFDLADESTCAALVAATVDAFGGVDGLFNVGADLSPATLGRDTDLLEVPVEVWQRALDVDLSGYFRTARHVVPALVERGGGAIVNTISGLVLYGEATRVSYGTAKSGLLALSKHIALRWGKQNVRCNVVAPGLVLTENAMGANSEEYRAMVLERIPSPRLGRVDDIAAAVAFLLSDDAEWINGQVLPVNGGRGLG